MKIKKIYWQWDENLNETEFKLGANIQELIDKGLVKKSYEPRLYKGINEVPCNINVDDNNIILSIFYRETFFSINGEYIGNLNAKEFIPKMNLLLESADENFKGNRLYAVFRDSFLAIIIISKA